MAGVGFKGGVALFQQRGQAAAVFHRNQGVLAAVNQGDSGVGGGAQKFGGRNAVFD